MRSSRWRAMVERKNILCRSFRLRSRRGSVSSERNGRGRRVLCIGEGKGHGIGETIWCRVLRPPDRGALPVCFDGSRYGLLERLIHDLEEFR